MSELAARLKALHRAESSPARTVAAEQIVRRIESEGPDHLLPSAYELLVSSYVFGTEPEKSFVPFARWLQLHDSRPDLFDEDALSTLLWAFRWMGLRASNYPHITFEQVEATIADMERRYAEAGWDMDAVRLDRYLWAWYRDAPETERLYWEWVHEPRREVSDCAAACDASGEAEYLWYTGRAEQAAARVERALADGRFCSSEPQVMLLILAEASLALGRRDEAALAYRRSIGEFPPGLRDHHSYPRGKIIRFLARAGHPELAVLRIEGEQWLLTGAKDPSAQFYFLMHVAGAARMMALTQPDLPVRLTDVPVATVAELARWTEVRARELAAAFDRRNRSDAHVRELERELTLEPVVEPLRLEIVPRAWRDESAPAALPARAADEGLASSEGPSETAAAAVDPLSDEHIDQLHAEARWLAGRGRADEAVQLFTRVSELALEAGNLRRVGTAAANLGQIASRCGDVPGVDLALRRAYGYLRAGGGDLLSLALVTRLWAPAACAVGNAAPALEALRAVRAQITEHLAHDDADDAAELGKELVDSIDTEARTLATLGQHDEAARLALEAARGFADAGLVIDAVQSLLLAARVHVTAGRDAESVEAFEFALEGLEQAPRPKLRAEAVTELAAVLRRLGRAADAEALEESLLTS